MSRIGRWVAAVALATSSLGVAGEAAAELLSHRALYRTTLATSADGSRVVAASGRMFYRFARECAGWTVENRTVLSLTFEGGDSLESVWTYASLESEDGRGMRFRARYEQDGVTTEKLKGHAMTGKPGLGGLARFDEPDGETITLPEGTLLPAAHMRAVIAAAEAGGTTLTRIVFDGQSVDNPYTVSAVFGPLGTDAAGALAEAAGLPAAPAWWIRMAYHPLAGDDAEPEFEIGSHIRADGVFDRIVQNFGTFSLDVRLEELEPLPPPDC